MFVLNFDLCFIVTLGCSLFFREKEIVRWGEHANLHKISKDLFISFEAALLVTILLPRYE